MKRLNYEATGNLVDDVSTVVYHCCYLLWTIQIREKLIKLACSSNLIDSCGNSGYRWGYEQEQKKRGVGNERKGK